MTDLFSGSCRQSQYWRAWEKSRENRNNQNETNHIDRNNGSLAPTVALGPLHRLEKQPILCPSLCSVGPRDRFLSQDTTRKARTCSVRTSLFSFGYPASFLDSIKDVPPKLQKAQLTKHDGGSDPLSISQQERCVKIAEDTVNPCLWAHSVVFCNLFL